MGCLLSLTGGACPHTLLRKKPRQGHVHKSRGSGPQLRRTISPEEGRPGRREAVLHHWPPAENQMSSHAIAVTVYSRTHLHGKALVARLVAHVLDPGIVLRPLSQEPRCL